VTDRTGVQEVGDCGSDSSSCREASGKGCRRSSGSGWRPGTKSRAASSALSWRHARSVPRDTAAWRSRARSRRRGDRSRPPASLSRTPWHRFAQVAARRLAVVVLGVLVRTMAWGPAPAYRAQKPRRTVPLIGERRLLSVGTARCAGRRVRKGRPSTRVPRVGPMPTSRRSRARGTSTARSSCPEAASLARRARGEDLGRLSQSCREAGGGLPDVRGADRMKQPMSRFFSVRRVVLVAAPALAAVDLTRLLPDPRPMHALVRGPPKDSEAYRCYWVVANRHRRGTMGEASRGRSRRPSRRSRRP